MPGRNVAMRPKKRLSGSFPEGVAGTKLGGSSPVRSGARRLAGPTTPAATATDTLAGKNSRLEEMGGPLARARQARASAIGTTGADVLSTILSSAGADSPDAKLRKKRAHLKFAARGTVT